MMDKIRQRILLIQKKQKIQKKRQKKIKIILKKRLKKIKKILKKTKIIKKKNLKTSLTFL